MRPRRTTRLAAEILAHVEIVVLPWDWAPQMLLDRHKPLVDEREAVDKTESGDSVDQSLMVRFPRSLASNHQSHHSHFR